MGILLAGAIALAALIVTPSWLFYFDVTPKVAVVLLAAAGGLVWGVFSSGAGGRKTRFFTILLAAQVVSLALSTALSTRPALSLVGTNWRRYGALVQCGVLVLAWLVAWYTAGDPMRIRTILRGIAVTGILVSLYGIAQYFGWDPILPAAAYHVGEGFWTIVRPPGTLGYVSYFATWLVFTVFLSLALLRLESDTAWRATACAAAALACLAMVLTGTRAAMLGLAAGEAVWLFRKGLRIPRKWLLAAGGGCLVLAAFYISPAGHSLRTRMRWFVEDPWGGARPRLWRDSLAMFLHRPILGYGPEVYTAEFPRYESQELARAYPDFVYESPHNMFLDAAVAQGLPGLFVLCGLVVLGFRTARPGLAAALAAGVVAQQFTVFTVPTALLTFVTIALAVSQAGKPVRLPKYVLAPAAAFLYASLCFVISDHALAQAREALNRGDEPSAGGRFAQYQRWRLPGSGGDLWYSRASLNLAQRSNNPAVHFQALIQAGIAGVRATTTAEDPVNAWYSMAILYAAQNDAAGTEKSLRAAISANPNWFKPHWTLAQVLRLQHRLPEAEQEAELAVSLDAGKDPEVARTLAEIRTRQP